MRCLRAGLWRVFWTRWTVAKRPTLNVGCTIPWIVVIVNEQEKTNWTAALTSLGFLTIETVRPAASRSYSHDFLSWWAARSTCEPKQTLPSLRGFCEACCHGVQKIANTDWDAWTTDERMIKSTLPAEQQIHIALFKHQTPYTSFVTTSLRAPGEWCPDPSPCLVSNSGSLYL